LEPKNVENKYPKEDSIKRKKQKLCARQISGYIYIGGYGVLAQRYIVLDGRTIDTDR
jgi:hypothetical protein